MNYDATSLPPSLIQDCEPALAGAPRADETVRGLVDSGLQRFCPARLDSIPADSIAPPAKCRRGAHWFVKRSCDYMCTAAALLLLWPFLLLIAVLIRLDSRG